MTIFGQSRLGRIKYIVVLALLICFDFAKLPIQRYIMKQHDVAAAEFLSPATKTHQKEVLPVLNGKPMPLMIPGQADVIRDIIKEQRDPNKEDVDKVLGLAISSANTDLVVLDGRRVLYERLHTVAVIGMSAITVIGLLWMVSSRLRDIEAPQYIMWMVVAPFFGPGLLGIKLSVLGAQVLTAVFMGALIILALLPAAGSGSVFPRRTAVEPPVVIKSREGQFGKRGLK